MFGIDNYINFVVIGILLNLTPGNDTIYILTRGISQGRKAAVYSVYGIACGALLHTFFAAIGLSAILTTSAFAYQIVKYLGAGYLVFLGIKCLVSKNTFHFTGSSSMSDLGRIFRQGLLTNLLNPKVALFYFSFLPQFVSTDNTFGSLPFIILGLTFITTGSIWCFFLAFSSSYIGTFFQNNKIVSQGLNKGSGLVFVLLGIKIAFERK